MYVVIYDWAYDGEEGMHVFECESKEHAKRKVRRIKAYEKLTAQEKKYAIYEETDCCFDAGNQSNYHNEHIKICIKRTKARN